MPRRASHCALPVRRVLVALLSLRFRTLVIALACSLAGIVALSFLFPLKIVVTNEVDTFYIGGLGPTWSITRDDPENTESPFPFTVHATVRCMHRTRGPFRESAISVDLRTPSVECADFPPRLVNQLASLVAAGPIAPKLAAPRDDPAHIRSQLHAAVLASPRLITAESQSLRLLRVAEISLRVVIAASALLLFLRVCEALYIATLANHLCRTCRYDLRGLRDPICPECGTRTT